MLHCLNKNMSTQLTLDSDYVVVELYVCVGLVVIIIISPKVCTCWECSHW